MGKSTWYSIGEFPEVMCICQKRTLMLEADSVLTELYYYDDTTGTEYLLWKKGE